MHIYVVGRWLVNIYPRENQGRKGATDIYVVKGKKIAIA